MGQTRTIRACPLHVCFTPKLGRSEVPAELAEKGQKRTSLLERSTPCNAAQFWLPGYLKGKKGPTSFFSDCCIGRIDSWLDPSSVFAALLVFRQRRGEKRARHP